MACDHIKAFGLLPFPHQRTLVSVLLFLHFTPCYFSCVMDEFLSLSWLNQEPMYDVYIMCTYKHLSPQVRLQLWLKFVFVVCFFFSSRLKNYILGEPDPLVDGIPKRDNPYIKKGGCTILWRTFPTRLWPLESTHTHILVTILYYIYIYKPQK